MQTVKQPVICILSTETFEVKVLDLKFTKDQEQNNGVKLFPSQPVFTTDNELVFTGISVGSKKLGLTYIYCRPSAIYSININLEDDRLIPSKYPVLFMCQL